MKSLLVQLDEPAEFVRSAIRKAIRETEEERSRRAYLEQPDAESHADDWSSAEQWKSRSHPNS